MEVAVTDLRSIPQFFLVVAAGGDFSTEGVELLDPFFSEVHMTIADIEHKNAGDSLKLQKFLPRTTEWWKYFYGF